MEKIRQKVSMGFTREPFPEGTHMCLIFDDDIERKNIISRFLASGIARGERVGYVVDKTPPEEVRDWLNGSGFELPEEEREDSTLLLYGAESIYYPSGEFVPSEVLAFAGEHYERAINAGYAGLRGSGEMSWALKGVPGSERLMEFEALVNTFLSGPPITSICQYDARLFDGGTLLNVLKVHPMMIVKGRIVRNPYYMEPEEFLEELTQAAARVGIAHQ